MYPDTCTPDVFRYGDVWCVLLGVGDVADVADVDNVFCYEETRASAASEEVRESACTAVRAIVESLCPWRISFKPYPASWESTLPLSDKRHSSK